MPLRGLFWNVRPCDHIFGGYLKDTATIFYIMKEHGNRMQHSTSVFKKSIHGWQQGSTTHRCKCSVIQINAFLSIIRVYIYAFFWFVDKIRKTQLKSRGCIYFWRGWTKGPFLGSRLNLSLSDRNCVLDFFLKCCCEVSNSGSWLVKKKKVFFFFFVFQGWCFQSRNRPQASSGDSSLYWCHAAVDRVCICWLPEKGDGGFAQQAPFSGCWRRILRSFQGTAPFSDLNSDNLNQASRGEHLWIAQ